MIGLNPDLTKMAGPVVDILGKIKDQTSILLADDILTTKYTGALTDRQVKTLKYVSMLICDSKVELYVDSDKKTVLCVYGEQHKYKLDQSKITTLLNTGVGFILGDGWAVSVRKELPNGKGTKRQNVGANGRNKASRKKTRNPKR